MALILIFVFLTVPALPIFAQSEQTISSENNNPSTQFKFITLKDGTQLKGRLIAVNNDIYTFETTSLGQLNIHGENISSINSGNFGSAPNSALTEMPSSVSAEQKQQVQALQRDIMANPEAMEEIKTMAEDPKIVELLKDPELMKDILSYDLEKIKNNPKTMQFFENDKIQSLIQKIGQKNGQLAQ